MNFSPANVSSLVWRHIYPPVRIVIRRWVKKADDSDETTHQRNVIFFDHTNTDKSQSRKSNLKTTKGKTWMGATVKEMCMNQWGKQERYRFQAAGKMLGKNILIFSCPSLDYDAEYWVLPIFIFFIISGVFGNILVCLAISTNR